MVPTRPGAYTFHFTGTIRGDAIDETFKSSDTTFDDIKAASEVEFPAKDPSTGELAQRHQGGGQSGLPRRRTAGR